MKFSQMPYQRVDGEALKQSLRELIDRSSTAASAGEQFAIHKDYYDLMADAHTNMTLANIRHDIDTTEPFYKAEKEYYDNLRPEVANLDTEYHKVLYSSPFRAELEKKLGAPAFKNIEISMRANDEKLISLRQQENALTTRYSNLIASARIEFEGGTYNLAMLRPFLVDGNRDTRSRAWKALSAWFQSKTAEIDDIYDQLVKNRTKQARMLGMENFVELGYLRMRRNCYDRKMVENFRDQVKKYLVPYVSELHEQRRARLGVDKLCHYDNDVYFAHGNPAPVGTPEQILAAGREMYAELSPETREFMDFMCENELFDVLGRPNKRQGGYMTFLPNYKSPFIFANFNGTNGDADVITHECGHAFQGYLMRDEEIREFTDIGMETAEIHSMSMEYFTYPWMEKFFGSAKEEYLQMHLAASIIFIPYGCMVDEFQHIVYENPDLTPAERKAAWARLEKEYRPHLHFEEDDYLAGGIWQRQHHIFTSPFYYIDYALASIVAMEFKARMDEDYKAAWADYLKLCRLSARDFYVNMLPQANLVVPFEEGFVEALVEKFRAKTAG